MIFREKLKLLRGLLHGEIAYGGPSYLVLDVTLRCNIRCRGCFFHGSPDPKRMPVSHQITDVTSEVVDRICREFPRLGKTEIFLIGEGEPFLHPDLFNFVASFKKAGLKVHIFTNGTLLDEGRIEKIINSNLDVLVVTFWAVNEQEHENCHPGVSTIFLEKRIKGLELLKQAKQRKSQELPLVCVSMPLNKYNYLNLEERMALIRQTHCDSVYLNFFRNWGSDSQDLTLSMEDSDAIRKDLLKMKKELKAVGVENNIDEYLSRVKLAPNFWNRIPCYVGWFQTYITVDGTVIPCSHCYYQVGNLLDTPFKAIWNGTKMKKFRRHGINLIRENSPFKYCDCPNCCRIRDNLRVHRIFKLIAPLKAAIMRAPNLDTTFRK
jgi:radical SAM protein with 4Fe4S-binding SPASM domain